MKRMLVVVEFQVEVPNDYDYSDITVGVKDNKISFDNKGEAVIVDWDIVEAPSTKWDYDKFYSHVGHSIECVCYGGSEEDSPDNISIECMDCFEVLTSANHPEE